MTPGALLVAGALAAVAYDGRYDSEIDAAIASTAHVYPVPRPLVLAIIQAESNFDPRAVSRAGAIGLMQVMPATARKVGVDPADLFEPRHNVLAGVRLLAVLLRHYRGGVVDALVAYNAGPRRSLALLPRNGETPGYVASVLRLATRGARAAGHVRPGATSHGRGVNGSGEVGLIHEELVTSTGVGIANHNLGNRHPGKGPP